MSRQREPLKADLSKRVEVLKRWYQGEPYSHIAMDMGININTAFRYIESWHKDNYGLSRSDLLFLLNHCKGEKDVA